MKHKKRIAVCLCVLLLAGCGQPVPDESSPVQTETAAPVTVPFEEQSGSAETGTQPLQTEPAVETTYAPQTEPTDSPADTAQSSGETHSTARDTATQVIPPDEPDTTAVHAAPPGSVSTEPAASQTIRMPDIEIG